jgi:SAM-dependent methyltransferase
VDHWQDVYRCTGAVWGDTPSEIARRAVADLTGRGLHRAGLRVLDIGCGYGRDLVYLRDRLDAVFIGVDASPAALDLARDRLADDPRVELRLARLQDIELGRFDVLLAANVYHLLQPPQRDLFRRLVLGHLRPGGLLYLSTASVRDPQHYGAGRAVPGEAHSFIDRGYLHFSTGDELAGELGGLLRIDVLEEIEYREPRTDGRDHHHVSWIVIGRAPGAVDDHADRAGHARRASGAGACAADGGARMV